METIHILFAGAIVVFMLFLDWLSQSPDVYEYAPDEINDLESEEGWIAAFDGMALEDNPYPPDDLKAESWAKGWECYQKEMKRYYKGR
jgi:hypothetical protein